MPIAMPQDAKDKIRVDDVVNLVLKLPPEQLVTAYEFLLFLQTKHRPTGKSQSAPHASIQSTPDKAFSASGIRVYSPRLVHREQASDFQLEVVEEETNAGL